MAVTTNLEKAFFHYILENPSQFKDVQPDYFKTSELKFVFQCIRDDYDKSDGNEAPTKAEIRELIAVNDKQNTITKDLLTTILKNNLTEYREEFLLPRYKSWKLVNSLRHGLADGIDLLRELNDTDLNEAQKAAEELRDKILKSTSIDYTDENDLGSDFDDAEAHNQEIHATKISSGFDTLDAMTGGGWDKKALICLMGETNIGKSIWMQNISVNAANTGNNVIYVSLEMSEKKVMKRLGAMRLKININEYDKLSRDRTFVAERIENLKRTHSNGIGFDGTIGRIWVKEFPAGTLTAAALDDYVEKLERHTGIKFHMIVIDYITLMCPEKRLNIDNNLYMKGKHLAEGIRAIGQKRDMSVITVTQIAKDKFGASDLNLNDMPESKAIAETADAVWGIIRNPTMKMQSIYHLKALKLRDADFNFDRIKFEINRNFLSLTDVGYVEAA